VKTSLSRRLEKFLNEVKADSDLALFRAKDHEALILNLERAFLCAKNIEGPKKLRSKKKCLPKR